jgi:hypothetical protein
MAFEDFESDGCEGSVLEAWLRGSSAALFPNSRSALSYVVDKISAGRVWYPAYTCGTSVVTNQPNFYPICEDSLTPDIDFLASNLSPGDVVVAIDYFGRSPDPTFISFVKSQPSIIWVQDCAQSVSPRVLWGTFQIFSPRKLFGVADGGVLTFSPEISTSDLPPFPQFTSLAPPGLMPRILRKIELRYAMDLGSYEEYVNSESVIAVQSAGISPLTYRQLRGINMASVVRSRVANHNVLSQALSDHSFFKNEISDWVPFGFAMKTESKESLIRRLFSRGVYPASHWSNLPSPKDAFEGLHVLAEAEITLPCDQRYSEEDMERLAKIVLEELSRESSSRL